MQEIKINFLSESASGSTV